MVVDLVIAFEVSVSRFFSLQPGDMSLAQIAVMTLCPGAISRFAEIPPLRHQSVQSFLAHLIALVTQMELGVASVLNLWWRTSVSGEIPARLQRCLEHLNLRY